VFGIQLKQKELYNLLAQCKLENHRENTRHSTVLCLV